MEDIRFIKKIKIGNINPNAPFSEKQEDEQMELLNRCLTEYPKGQILGRYISIGSFQLGEHKLTTQAITYHIGFRRKPQWLT